MILYPICDCRWVFGLSVQKRRKKQQKMLPLKLCAQIEIELFYVVYECVCMHVFVTISRSISSSVLYFERNSVCILKMNEKKIKKCRKTIWKMASIPKSKSVHWKKRRKNTHRNMYIVQMQLPDWFGIKSRSFVD